MNKVIYRDFQSDGPTDEAIGQGTDRECVNISNKFRDLVQRKAF